MALIRRRFAVAKVLVTSTLLVIVLCLHMLTSPGGMDEHRPRDMRRADSFEPALKRARDSTERHKPTPPQNVHIKPPESVSTRHRRTINFGPYPMRVIGGKSTTMTIAAPPKPVGPGEMGAPVLLPDRLTPEQQRRVDKGMREHAFNEYVSDMVSVRRSLRDVRNEKCREEARKRKTGGMANDGNGDYELSPASIIICFHNEAWSTLLRTVHSVVDRSPMHLVREILLVDDASNSTRLGVPLAAYMVRLPHVKIVRLVRRHGLIRARLEGVRRAGSRVLVFLDSHCECTDGWLEPLLYRVNGNSSTIAQPVIDTINEHTLEYLDEPSTPLQLGGFDWDMMYAWHPLPERERWLQRSPAAPVPTPVIAGGIFAADRRWLAALGDYDPGLDVWGAENLELSFKAWMCGGRLEVVPCSHVGHIYRSHTLYPWNSLTGVMRNNIRVAEVWMDEYKDIFYKFYGMNVSQIDYGDVSARHALRRQLKCHSFRWYISNVYPELFIPTEAVASGEIRSEAAPVCLDASESAPVNTLTSGEDVPRPVSVRPCHGRGGSQHWLLSRRGEIRRELADTCLDYFEEGLPQLRQCHGAGGNQYWQYSGGTHQLMHAGDWCLAVVMTGPAEGRLETAACNERDPRLRWTVEGFGVSTAQAL